MTVFFCNTLQKIISIHVRATELSIYKCEYISMSISLLMQVAASEGKYHHQRFSVQRYSVTASHISNIKIKTCYICMFHRLTLGSDSFHQVIVRRIFCEPFTQNCHVSANKINAGLVFAPYFTRFFDETHFYETHF